jgi:hypothetical protein
MLLQLLLLLVVVVVVVVVVMAVVMAVVGLIGFGTEVDQPLYQARRLLHLIAAAVRT